MNVMPTIAPKTQTSCSYRSCTATNCSFPTKQTLHPILWHTIAPTGNLIVQPTVIPPVAPTSAPTEPTLYPTFLPTDHPSRLLLKQLLLSSRQCNYINRFNTNAYKANSLVKQLLLLHLDSHPSQFQFLLLRRLLLPNRQYNRTTAGLAQPNLSGPL